jgi:plasmid stabilization system protein ParE
MPRKLKFRLRARRDLYAIVLFISKQNKDWTVARRFGGRLISRCRDLVKAPYSGSTQQIGADVRKIVEGPYKIFYRVSETKIVILRIWDGRRGHDPLL